MGDQREQEPVDRTLTYRELAELLGVTVDGARTRARRSGWPKVRGNDGRARVRVPLSELPEQAERTGRATTEQTTVRPGAHHDRGEQAEHWRSQAEHERVIADILRDQLARERARIEQLEAELRELRQPWVVRLVRALRG